MNDNLFPALLGERFAGFVAAVATKREDVRASRDSSARSACGIDADRDRCAAQDEIRAGFLVDQTPVGRVVGDSGEFLGISSQLSMYLDSGYTVAVMSNYGNAALLVEGKGKELILQGR